MPLRSRAPSFVGTAPDYFTATSTGFLGSGKTTFLRSLNRLSDQQAGFTHTGRILLDGKDIFDPATDVPALRRRVGMVYAVPTPLPWSIYDNIAYGPRMAGIRGSRQSGRQKDMSFSSARACGRRRAA